MLELLEITRFVGLIVLRFREFAEFTEFIESSASFREHSIVMRFDFRCAVEWSVRRLDPLPHQVARRSAAMDAVQAQLLPVLPGQTLLLRAFVGIVLAFYDLLYLVFYEWDGEKRSCYVAHQKILDRIDSVLYSFGPFVIM